MKAFFGRKDEQYFFEMSEISNLTTKRHIQENLNFLYLAFLFHSDIQSIFENRNESQL
jgi:hypothetical protein